MSVAVLYVPLTVICISSLHNIILNSLWLVLVLWRLLLAKKLSICDVIVVQVLESKCLHVLETKSQCVRDKKKSKRKKEYFLSSFLKQKLYSSSTRTFLSNHDVGKKKKAFAEQSPQYQNYPKIFKNNIVVTTASFYTLPFSPESFLGPIPIW